MVTSLGDVVALYSELLVEVVFIEGGNAPSLQCTDRLDTRLDPKELDPTLSTSDDGSVFLVRASDPGVRKTREDSAAETFAGNVSAFRTASMSADVSATVGEWSRGGRGGGGVVGSMLKAARGGGGRGPAVA